MAPDDVKAVLAALRNFADAVRAKLTQLTAGEPEDQLRAPFENFIQETGAAIARRMVCTGEVRLRIGKPDYAVHSNGLLVGHVELKAPGVGADPNRFAGHNREQWKRFQALPNLIYCDGNEWGLYRSGEKVGRVVRLSGDVATDGRNAVDPRDGQSVLALLTDFLSWQPIIPKNAKDLADLLAPLCRMLRDDVTDALKDPQSPLVQLAKDWRQLLFSDASDQQFADGYAQTVTFALLLARSEGADPLTLASAEAALAAEHGLLSRALQVFTDPNAQPEISASLSMLIRIIREVPPAALTGPKNPWLYFYEDFLAAYDPKLRKDAGAYYTPVEVVRAQVSLVDDLLTTRLGKVLGFADGDVVTLDPAVGTGTYLLGVIDHALGKVEAQQGAGAVSGKATTLAGNIYGFEIMAGPYAVCELRVSRDLQDKGAKLPAGGTHVYLTDTLESPNTPPPALPFYLKPIAEQHTKALEVKVKVPVIVCLGNPPYDRHEAVDPRSASLSSFGGWVRFGDPITPSPLRRKGKKAALDALPSRNPRALLRKRELQSILYSAFIKPTIDAGHGVDIKNVYNLYVYFWRWALWKVFEHTTSTGPGVVCFISASSYMDGDAFCGMREHMRRLCDEIWILDLGGEGRGTRKSENVFAIQTPVAIAVAVRYGKADKDTPAKAHHACIAGTRDEKLRALDAIAEFSSLQWQDCPDDWHAPFRPAGVGAFFEWPLLTDLLPWQPTGLMAGRTWVIGPSEKCLRDRWCELLRNSPEKRCSAFVENATGRKATDKALSLRVPRHRLKEIRDLPQSTGCPEIMRFGFRSFDRQYLIADGRMIDRPCPDLWECLSPNQAYLTSLLNHPLGTGPALTASANMPDKHAFRGSYGGKNVFPFYRDSSAAEANMLPGLLDLLGAAYKRKVTPEDFLAYIYGALAQPAFTACYAKELETRELRVPLTRDAALFAQVRDVGAKLLWLHTYGERFVPKGHHRGRVPQGAARCVKAVPDDAANYPERYEHNDATRTLLVGGGQFAPVAREVYEFEVSGLKVVQSWLKYRMKKGGGKKSSPLDDIRPDRWTSDFTTELLELLWVLEATLAEYPAQAELLPAVVKGPCFRANELPDVPDAARGPLPASAPTLFDKPK